MKVLFSLLWLLNFSPLPNPPGEPVTAAPATPAAQPAKAPPVRSMGTVIEFFEGQGIGRIKPNSSNTTITVLMSDVNGKVKVEINSQVSYIESNDLRRGRRATEVEVIKP